MLVVATYVVYIIWNRELAISMDLPRTSAVTYLHFVITPAVLRALVSSQDSITHI